MAKSTGPILIAGGITLLDKVTKGTATVPEFLKVAVATSIAALVLDGFEHVSPPLAVGIAWIAVVTVILTSNVVKDLTTTTGLGKAK
jgi:hypothetical protein